MPVFQRFHSPRILKVALWSGGVALLFALLGYFAAAPAAKFALTRLLGAALQREVSIREVVIQPFTPSVRLRGFVLKERDASATAVDFDELFVSMEALPLLRGDLVFREIRLTAPHVRLVRHADRSYNVADLADLFLKPDTAPQWRFSMNHLQVIDGRIDFDDKPAGRRHQFSDFHLSLPFLSNMPSHAGVVALPVLKARINGRDVALSGNVQPFGDERRATLGLELSGLDLAPYLDYLPEGLPFKARSGYLDARLRVEFVPAPGKPAALRAGGQFLLKALEIADMRGMPVFGLERIKVQIDSADVLGGKTVAGSMEMAGLDVRGHVSAAIPLEIAGAGIDAVSRFRVNFDHGSPRVRLDGLSARLKNLRLLQPGQKQPFFSLAEATVGDGHVDWEGRLLEIGSIAARGGKLIFRRGRDGALDLAGLLPTPLQGEVKRQPWIFSVKKLAVDGHALFFEDSLPEQPVTVGGKVVSFTVENLSTAPGATGTLNLQGTLGGGGITAAGTLALNPVHASLRVDTGKIGLVPLRPYLSQVLTAAVAEGKVSARGNLEVAPPAVRFDGEVGTANFASYPHEEAWKVRARWQKPGWSVHLDAAGKQAARLAGFLPPDGIRPTAGIWSGSLDLEGEETGVSNARLDVVFDVLDFSDAGGLHAGEKVGGGMNAGASRGKQGWQWQGAADWQNGEVFWQPLYFAQGGHRVSAQGTLLADTLCIEQGKALLAGVGAAQFSGVWNMDKGKLEDAGVQAEGVDVAGLYQTVLKPFLEKTAFGKVQAKGTADLQWRYRDGATREVDLKLHATEFVDEEQRFALRGISAHIPWSVEAARQAELTFRSGEVLHLALGETRMPLTLDGWNVSAPEFSIPLLDGRLNLDGLAAGLGADGAWQWRFSGGLTPVSMARFSEALKLPRMHGTFSGVIPAVSYVAGTVRVEGALLFKVFDGTVVAKELVLHEPFGRAPRLAASLDMRNLDLDLLTRTFSFGSMQGRIDVEANGLELSNWRPVKFDARVSSSPGDYPRKISQRAVQNISALGGAGAAAAIQRSFLSFFEQFGYERIGLSCALRNGVCLMGGVEPAPQGYVIVKGGGVPAINVIGYNRQVGWEELLERLQRITQKNVAPLIQ
jgi:hypothetical protein